MNVNLNFLFRFYLGVIFLLIITMLVTIASVR
jgi:hypothetical protein